MKKLSILSFILASLLLGACSNYPCSGGCVEGKDGTCADMRK